MPRKKTSPKKPASASPLRRSTRLRRSPCHDCQGCSEGTPPAKKAGKQKSGSDDRSPTVAPDVGPASSSSFSNQAPTSKPAAPAAVPVGDDEQSVSAVLRLEGNIQFKKAMQEGIPAVIKNSRLEDALRLYTRAANTADDGPTKLADWSSATKNCGMAAKHMAQESLHGGDDEMALKRFKESLKFMSQALMRGGDSHGQAWKSKLEDEMEALYFEAIEIVHCLTNIKEKVGELYQVSSFLLSGVVLAGAKHHVGDLLFKESVRLLEKGNYKECLNCLHDIHQPVEEALGLLRGRSLDLQTEELQLDLKVLKRDTRYHISTAESIQARKCGEELLKRVFESEEYLDMDLVWITVDWFKEASLKAAELDLEQEAAALSFLGLMNQKILFSTTKSKSYYKRCLELVDAAKPKTFLTEKWYQQCVAGFQQIQDVERRRDEAAQQKIRQKILDTIKDELAAISKANTQASSLMEHLYKHHAPPKAPHFSAKNLQALQKVEKGPQGYEERKEKKKLLLKACQDFHPDKFSEKEGETEDDKAKRKVLMEEITKMITKYYEDVKLG